MIDEFITVFPTGKEYVILESPNVNAECISKPVSESISLPFRTGEELRMELKIGTIVRYETEDRDSFNKATDFSKRRIKQALYANILKEIPALEESVIASDSKKSLNIIRKIEDLMTKV